MRGARTQRADGRLFLKVGSAASDTCGRLIDQLIRADLFQHLIMDTLTSGVKICEALAQEGHLVNFLVVCGPYNEFSLQFQNVYAPQVTRLLSMIFISIA